MNYFHGSYTELPVGTTMTGRGDQYEQDWINADFYCALERYRPDGLLPHKHAVFMVDTPDNVDSAGGGTEWIFEVQPSGPITRHDLNWSTRISKLISNGRQIDSNEIKLAATSYWNGLPLGDDPLWEYIAPAATILRCEPFESFDIDQNQPTPSFLFE